MAGLVALAAVLALLWFALVKPQITAATQSAVKKQVTPISMALNHVSSTVPSSAGLATSSTSRSKAGPLYGNANLDRDWWTGNGGRIARERQPDGERQQQDRLLRRTEKQDPGSHRHSAAELSWRQRRRLPARQREGSDVMGARRFQRPRYHWITPVYFRPDSKLQLTVKDCTGACAPSLYFAGNMKSAQNDHDRPTSPAQ